MLKKYLKYTVHNVECSWIYLASPSVYTAPNGSKTDNGYRLTFPLKKGSPEHVKLENAINDFFIAKMGGKTLDYVTGRKDDKDDPSIVWYQPKQKSGLISTSPTNKGEEIKPAIYSAGNKRLNNNDFAFIRNGAIMNVEFNLCVTSYQKQNGVAMYLNAVQLVKYELGRSSGFSVIHTDEEPIDINEITSNSGGSTEYFAKPEDRFLNTKEIAGLWLHAKKNGWSQEDYSDLLAGTGGAEKIKHSDLQEWMEVFTSTNA
jgi:hypothetical protein